MRESHSFINGHFVVKYLPDIGGEDICIGADASQCASSMNSIESSMEMELALSMHPEEKKEVV